MNSCEANKDKLGEDIYQFERTNIIKFKYMHYYEALNHKYNDFIQENDYGKLWDDYNVYLILNLIDIIYK